MTPARRVGPEGHQAPRAPAGAEPHLARVTVPSLVINADADTGVFPSDAQRIFGAIAADDKQLVEVEGDHYLLSPGPARGAVADLIEAWAQKHVI